jgi:uncharacterized membrane protein
MPAELAKLCHLLLQCVRSLLLLGAIYDPHDSYAAQILEMSSVSPKLSMSLFESAVSLGNAPMSFVLNW